MLFIIQSFLDYLFPPPPNELKLRGVQKARMSHWYQPALINDVTYLCPYKLPEVKSAIAACKFEHNYHASFLLGKIVETHLADLPPKPTLIIPIPLSVKRERKRGFNQVTRVLTYIKNLPYHYKISTNLLVRQIDTTPQTSLNRQARLKNLSSAFTIVPKNLWQLEDVTRVILCDDVLTTGATLETARAVLSRHLTPNIELICIAWSH